MEPVYIIISRLFIITPSVDLECRQPTRADNDWPPLASTIILLPAGRHSFPGLGHVHLTSFKTRSYDQLDSKLLIIFALNDLDPVTRIENVMSIAVRMNGGDQRMTRTDTDSEVIAPLVKRHRVPP